MLSDALTTLVCRRYQMHEAGDHYIIVGEIQHCRSQTGNPLVFHNGKYQQTNLHQALNHTARS